jgi:hypothetical protein
MDNTTVNPHEALAQHRKAIRLAQAASLLGTPLRVLDDDFDWSQLLELCGYEGASDEVIFLTRVIITGTVGMYAFPDQVDTSILREYDAR